MKKEIMEKEVKHMTQTEFAQKVERILHNMIAKANGKDVADRIIFDDLGDGKTFRDVYITPMLKDKTWRDWDEEVIAQHLYDEVIDGEWLEDATLEAQIDFAQVIEDKLYEMIARAYGEEIADRAITGGYDSNDTYKDVYIVPLLGEFDDWYTWDPVDAAECQYDSLEWYLSKFDRIDEDED